MDDILILQLKIKVVQEMIEELIDKKFKGEKKLRRLLLDRNKFIENVRFEGILYASVLDMDEDIFERYIKS